MSFRYHSLFILLVALICGAATCERERTWAYDEDIPAELVIISDFEPGELLQVEVKRTSSSLADLTGEEYIDNAYVKVTELAGTQPTERLDYIPIGEGNRNWSYYQSRLLRPIIGMEYEIEVSVPGFEDVSAVSTIPIPVDLSHFEILNTIATPIDDTTTRYDFVASIKFEDPIEQENYYQIRFSQQIHKYNLSPTGDTIYDPSKSIIDIIEFKTETSEGLKKSLTGEGIFFKDDSELIFDLNLRVNPTTELLGQLFIDFRTVSKEYYGYFRNAGSQLGNSGGSFGAPTSSPIVSNVRNGQGVFAGYSTSKDSISVPIVN